jgi:hypothetical protein
VYDCDETKRAVSLHLAWCKRNGFILDQPNSARSGRDGNIVTLANVRRVQAQYRIGKTGRLRRLDLVEV